MQNTPVLYAVRDGYAEITLNRPEQLNSFTAEMHAGLRESLDKAMADGARAILITGAGRGFCAGQDLMERKIPGPGETIDLRVFLRERYNPLIKRMREIPLPIVVAPGANATRYTLKLLPVQSRQEGGLLDRQPVGQHGLFAPRGHQ